MESELTAVEEKIEIESGQALSAEKLSDTAPGQTSGAEPENQNISLWDSIKLLFLASRAFWIVNFVSFGDGIAYFGVLTLLTRYLGSDLAMGTAQAGLSVSLFTGLVTLSVAGGGWAADKLGVRRALLVSLGIILVGRVLLAFCPHIGIGTAASLAAVGSLVIMALGYGILEPSMYSGVKEYTDPRTAAISYSLLYAIMNLGIVASNFVSPYIRTDSDFLQLGSVSIKGLGMGIEGVYWACAFITLIMFLGVLCFLTKKVDEHDRYVSPEAKSEAAESDSKAQDEESSLSWWENLSRHLGPLADKRFLFFIFMLLPVRTLFAHQWLTIPDYVFRCYPAEVADKFEWLTGLNPLIICIFVPLFAALTHKVKVIDMMLIGTFVSAATTFLLVPGPDLTRLVLYLIIFSLGEALWSSRFLEYVAALAPSGKVGAYMGLAGIPWFLAKFTTGLYSGTVLDIFVPVQGIQHSGQMWFIYALVAMISPIALLLGRRWLLGVEKK
ncbi:MAG: MFS transporter [Candidatus Bruticola sp.]